MNLHKSLDVIFGKHLLLGFNLSHVLPLASRGHSLPSKLHRRQCIVLYFHLFPISMTERIHLHCEKDIIMCIAAAY